MHIVFHALNDWDLIFIIGFPGTTRGVFLSSHDINDGLPFGSHLE